MVLSQLIDVEAMAIQMVVQLFLLTIMHQHNLPHIPLKVTNQLFERVDLLLKVSLLLDFILHKLGLQGLELMLRVQILDNESQKASTNGYFVSLT